MAKKVLENLGPEKEEFKKSMKKAELKVKGEGPERNLQELARDFLKEKKLTAFMYAPLKFRKEVQPFSDMRENDLIIVSLVHQCVVVIEAKLTLGIDQAKKCGDQLEAFAEYFQTWFANDISETWKLVKVAYTVNCHELVKKECKNQDCTDFLVIGQNEFDEKIKKVFEKVGSKSLTLKAKEEFIKIVKYINFSAALRLPTSSQPEKEPTFKLPIGADFIDQTEKKIDQMGCLDSINTFVIPLPFQFGISGRKKVVFANTFGCGKTMFMVQEASELAKKGEKSAIIVFVRHESNFESLLVLDLKNKFPNGGLVKVIEWSLLRYEMPELDKDVRHIFLDECLVTMREEMLQLTDRKENVTTWVSFSAPSAEINKNVQQEVVNLRAFYEPKGFLVVDANEPMRLPKQQFRELKKAKYKDSFGDNLMSIAELKPNLLDGIYDEFRIKGTALQEALINFFSSNQLYSKQFALVVIPDNYTDTNTLSYKPDDMPEITESDWKEIICFICKSAGRPKPIFHLEKYSDQDEVSHWISGEKRDSDLVVCNGVIHGFEAKFIIDLTPKHLPCRQQVLSRSKAYYCSIHYSITFTKVAQVYCRKWWRKEMIGGGKATLNGILGHLADQIGLRIGKIFRYDSPLLKAIAEAVVVPYEQLEKDIITFLENFSALPLSIWEKYRYREFEEFCMDALRSTYQTIQEDPIEVPQETLAELDQLELILLNVASKVVKKVIRLLTVSPVVFADGVDGKREEIRLKIEDLETFHPRETQNYVYEVCILCVSEDLGIIQRPKIFASAKLKKPEASWKDFLKSYSKTKLARRRRHRHYLFMKSLQQCITIDSDSEDDNRGTPAKQRKRKAEEDMSD